MSEMSRHMTVRHVVLPHGKSLSHRLSILKVIPVVQTAEDDHIQILPTACTA